MVDRAKMKALVCESPDKALAEKFHASMTYLNLLNGGRKVESGKDRIVPNVAASATPVKAVSIQIDKAERVLYVLDASDRLVAGFPISISISNEKNDPLPVGVMAIKNEVKNRGLPTTRRYLKMRQRTREKWISHRDPTILSAASGWA